MFPLESPFSCCFSGIAIILTTEDAPHVLSNVERYHTPCPISLLFFIG